MVSIIIVNYKVKKELFSCLESLLTSKAKVGFEIIVVDNDEQKSISKELKKQFPKVVYIPNVNKGFGQGNNVGAKQAKGEYLFFLNPDTQVMPGAVDALVDFLQKKKDAGVVAPLLLGNDGKPYQQGTRELTPKRGIVALSFLNKLFPRNSISQKYFLSEWDRKTTKAVAVAPGTAFMIRKELFKKNGGFDEKFFLFFEEFDFCKRLRKLGYKIFIYPKAHVKHDWGVSTRQRSDIDTIFAESRFYYFRKHFGLFSALLVEGCARIGKNTVFMAGILSIGLFLRIHNLSHAMAFIGDQGWFYLSARDMLINGNIPLVGIASSHPWLHQGALWTYMLAGGFWALGFSPFVGAYLSIGFGFLGILGMYWLGSVLFSSRVGLVAAALFATSPLVIMSDRMPYHTAPIPFFTILFIYVLYKWVSGNTYFFPVVIFILGLLYNLELATALLGMVFIATLLYCFVVKRSFARELFHFKFLLLSIIAFIVSMSPMLIYDAGHGYPQTWGFMKWIGYKVLVLLGYPRLHESGHVAINQMVSYLTQQFSTLIFAYSGWVALVIFSLSLFFLLRRLLYSRVRGNDTRMGMRVLLVLNMLLVIGFLVAGTASGAYLPMMFPGLLLMTAVVIDVLLARYKSAPGFWIGTVGVLAVMGLNSYYSLAMNSSDDFFTKRLDAAKYIVKEADGKEYNLVGKGPGSQFESFTMNYEYLTWWMGNAPSKTKKQLQFTISETSAGVQVREKVIRK